MIGGVTQNKMTTGVTAPPSVNKIEQASGEMQNFHGDQKDD